MKRIFIVGPDFFGYNESVKDAFENSGFDVKVYNHYDGYKGLKNKVLCSKLSKLGILKFKNVYDEKLNNDILREYKNFNPDIVIVIKGVQISIETLKQMKNSIKVLWMMDSIYRYPNMIKKADAYDYKFMFENNDVEKLNKIGVESYFLPLAADKNKYFENQTVNKDIDILFIGSLYKNRISMFNRLSKDFPNLNIQVYGKYTNIKEPLSYIKYLNSNVRKIFKNCYIDSKEVNNLYSRSKICINLHHEQSKNGCNPRFYEILASKSFQIVDYNEYIVNKYKEKVDNFKTYDELKEKIIFYLNHPEERNKKIKLYDSIIEKNYFDNRIEYLLNIIYENSNKEGK